jgi:hypothetical protein
VKSFVIQVIDCVTVDFPNNLPYDDGSRASDTVFWNYHPNMVPQYHQSGTGTLVDYQSDQSFRYLHSQFAVENTLASSCPYETPFYSSAKACQNSLIRFNLDGSAGTQSGSFKSAQAVMEKSSQRENQALASDTLTDTRDNELQPSQSQLLGTQSAKLLASPSTGSGYDFVQSVTGTFYKTVKSDNCRLFELSITIQRNSMDARINLVVKNCESARSEYGDCAENREQSLTGALTDLADEALEIPGNHEFRVHSDEFSTKIDVKYSNHVS